MALTGFHGATPWNPTQAESPWSNPLPQGLCRTLAPRGARAPWLHGQSHASLALDCVQAGAWPCPAPSRPQRSCSCPPTAGLPPSGCMGLSPAVFMAPGHDWRGQHMDPCLCGVDRHGCSSGSRLHVLLWRHNTAIHPPSASQSHRRSVHPVALPEETALISKAVDNSDNCLLPRDRARA